MIDATEMRRESIVIPPCLWGCDIRLACLANLFRAGMSAMRYGLRRRVYASTSAMPEKGREMIAFDLVAGLVGVAGLVFSVWVYADAKRKEAVEVEKASTFTHRLADVVSMMNAVGAQASVVANLSDREETTKKELKHLLVAQMMTIRAAQESLVRIQATGRAWRFGFAGRYLDPAAEDDTGPDAEPA